MPETEFRAGFVAIVGRPNTGKSTLVNALMNEKISIVTSKPQTTRHSILGILTDEKSQAIFVDTPGLHAGSKKLMNRAMNRSANASMAGADLALFVTDATGWTRGDDHALECLRDAGIPAYLIVNKLDLLRRRSDLLPVLADFSARGEFNETVPISASRGSNLEHLLAIIKKNLPVGPPLFDLDITTDRGMAFRIAEILREKLLFLLHDEVPYGLAVEILALEQRDALMMVDATIWVDKDSHQGIVVGRGGERIKKINTNARLDLEQTFGQKFYLSARVRVKENWSDNARALRQLGYDEAG